jgi:hypothetical protein
VKGIGYEGQAIGKKSAHYLDKGNREIQQGCKQQVFLGIVPFRMFLMNRMVMVMIQGSLLF